MDAEKIGQFIYKLRTDKNLTQSQLADSIHVTNKAISRWERGIGFPDISLLEPLSNELGVSILELLKGEKLNKNDYVAKDDINTLLEVIINIKKKSKKNNLILLSITTIIVIISIIYFKTHFSGFNNIYIEQLLNHISLVPFSNIYASIHNKSIIALANNIIINSLLGIIISYYIIYFSPNNKLKTIILINILLELFKWLMTIGIFDVDDIIIRCITCLIIVNIYSKKKIHILPQQ